MAIQNDNEATERLESLVQPSLTACIWACRSNDGLSAEGLDVLLECVEYQLRWTGATIDDECLRTLTNLVMTHRTRSVRHHAFLAVASAAPIDSLRSEEAAALLTLLATAATEDDRIALADLVAPAALGLAAAERRGVGPIAADVLRHLISWMRKVDHRRCGDAREEEKAVSILCEVAMAFPGAARRDYAYVLEHLIRAWKKIPAEEGLCSVFDVLHDDTCAARIKCAFEEVFAEDVGGGTN